MLELQHCQRLRFFSRLRHFRRFTILAVDMFACPAAKRACGVIASVKQEPKGFIPFTKWPETEFGFGHGFHWPSAGCTLRFLVFRHGIMAITLDPQHWALNTVPTKLGPQHWPTTDTFHWVMTIHRQPNSGKRADLISGISSQLLEKGLN